MGAQCGCGSAADDVSELNSYGKIPKNGVTLGNRHYSARDIYIIVRMQSYRRAIIARKRVQKLRFEMYSPGYNRDREDYDNVNVQVRFRSFNRYKANETRTRRLCL